MFLQNWLYDSIHESDLTILMTNTYDDNGIMTT